MSGGCFAWRTADGITHVAWPENTPTHVAWSESPETFAGRYTRCEPYKLRLHGEGQGVGGAVITCVRCLGVSHVWFTPPSVEADLGESW